MGSLSEWLAGGFAGWLAMNSLASWADVTGPYDSSTEWPIYQGPDMGTSPDRQMVITPGATTRTRADIVQALQIRYRGAQDEHPNSVMTQAQAVDDLCYPNGFPRVHVSLGYIRAGAILSGPGTPLGTDSRRRFEFVQNYRVRYRRPPMDQLPAQEYSLVGPGPFITSPDASIRTIVAMTQAEFDLLPADPTRAVFIIPEP